MRQRWGRTAAVALGVTLGLAAAPVGGVAMAAGTADGPVDGVVDGVLDPPADGGHDAPARPSWTSKDAAAYWTPERMAAAIAHAPGRARPRTTPVPPAGAAARPPAKPQLAPTARHFGGVPSVGVLFTVDSDAKTHHCTASVVHSPQGNLILTAGHCNPGTRAAFVPQYRSGATTQPYGIWAIGETFDYADRGTTGDGADLDFAFATVAPDARGRTVESVTGGNTLAATPGYTNKVTVIGYPSVRNDPQDRAVRCDTRTTRLTGTRQLRMECGGFYGGTSGSPWLTHFDERTRTGQIIGLIGGLNGGGPTGPHSDRTSYSPYFDAAIFDLYARAIQES
ncbi:trypsin-like serine peptidase [Streptomyces sp. NPDC101227]|uniref:trypsin-like serine peptidase n=1 Tax=Streptomyces sp. NPDC101227 TaxID=3366136 RepID=UPI00381821F0